MKKLLLFATCALWLLSLEAQQKTIAERLGYPKNTKLLILHADAICYKAAHEINFELLTKGN